jgi:hypothetical protein
MLQSRGGIQVDPQGEISMAEALRVDGIKFIRKDGKEHILAWAYQGRPSEQYAVALETMLRSHIGACQPGDELEFTSTRNMVISLEALAFMINAGTAHQLTSVKEGVLAVHVEIKKAKVPKAAGKARGRCSVTFTVLRYHRPGA